MDQAAHCGVVPADRLIEGLGIDVAEFPGNLVGDAEQGRIDYIISPQGHFGGLSLI